MNIPQWVPINFCGTQINANTELDAPNVSLVGCDLTGVFFKTILLQLSLCNKLWFYTGYMLTRELIGS